MSPQPAPPTSMQQIWDTAADLAMQGVALPVIVATVLDAAGPQIESDSVRAIPAHGRTFWGSMSKALAWGIAADISLIVIGSFGGRALPGLKVGLCLGVLLWAVGFGVVLANHKVRDRRALTGAARRAAVARLAQDAARHVWGSQVPGQWQPLGPAVEGRPPTDSTVPTAWLRRFGVAAGEAIGSMVDGSEVGLRGAIKAARGVPVVLFVPEPGFYTDEARSLADARGVALFIVGRNGLLAMSDAASRALKVYQDPASTRGPVNELLSGSASDGLRG